MSNLLKPKEKQIRSQPVRQRIETHIYGDAKGVAIGSKTSIRAKNVGTVGNSKNQKIKDSFNDIRGDKKDGWVKQILIGIAIAVVGALILWYFFGIQ